jgi:hypothetical protein
VLDATLTDLGGAGGASFAGTDGGGLLLNERRDTLELYPLSAFASGFGVSLGSFSFFDCVSTGYPESKDFRLRKSEISGVPGSGSKRSSSIAMCLLVASSLGEAGGEFSKENGLNARSFM